MKNAGQEIDDEDLAAYMKQKGLGTPATRAAIIERLLKTSYIERQKKYLMPTEKIAEHLIQQVHQDLKDVSLTASWEQGLADMQDGKLQLDLIRKRHRWICFATSARCCQSNRIASLLFLAKEK